MDDKPDRQSEMERRSVLEGLGAGALGLGLATGFGTATAERQSLGSLNVFNVEPGYMQFGGGWESAGEQVEIDAGFDVRIDVDGVDTQGETALAYMIAPAGPNGGFAAVHGAKQEDQMPSSSIWIGHGNPATRAFRPEIGPLSWTEGTYRIYATVIDRDQQAVGSGVSSPFEIS